jgi:two-component system, NarL family, response regulator DevR
MRVLVLERCRATCEGIAAGLSTEDDIEADATAFSVSDAVRMLDRPLNDIDVVVTTMSVGEEDMLGLARRLRDRASGPNLVVAGLPTSPGTIAHFLLAGVDAYLTEEVSIQGLALVLRLLERGEVLIAPLVAGRLVQLLQTQAGLLDRSGLDLSWLSTLTRRQRRVLDLIGDGASNREIADALFIEVSTVKSHVHAILKKLRVATREEARRLLILGRSRPDQDSNVDM